MTQLFLEDLAGYTDEKVRQHLMGEYEAKPEQLEEYRILIGYESVGSWGCDSSSYYLMQHVRTGELFEVRGSHCSCYGFEGQFTPEATSLEYLSSDKFYVSMGGYDSDEKANMEAIKAFVAKLLEGGV